MGLGLLWGYINTKSEIVGNTYIQPRRCGFIVSNDSALYRIFQVNARLWVVEGKGLRLECLTLHDALMKIYNTGNNKIAFRLVNGTNLIPNPIIGVMEKDIPDMSILDNANLKSYYWGKLRDGDDLHCIISADMNTCTVSADFISKSDVLNNRRGRYLNIIGEDGEIAIRAKQIRATKTIPDYLNATDVINRMQTRGLKNESVLNSIIPLYEIKPYTSKYTDEQLRGNEGFRGSTTLLLYGQFGRYKSAVKMMDYLLAPLSGDTYKNGVRYYDMLVGATELDELANHTCRRSNIYPMLYAFNKADFKSFLDDYLSYGGKSEETVVEHRNSIKKFFGRCGSLQYNKDKTSVILNENKGLKGYDFLQSFGLSYPLEQWNKCFDEFKKCLDDKLNNEFIPTIKNIYDDVDDSFKIFSRRCFWLVFENFKRNKGIVRYIDEWLKLSLYDKVIALALMCSATTGVDYNSLFKDKDFLEIYNKSTDAGKSFCELLDKQANVSTFANYIKLCSFTVKGVSVKDGFTERKYNVFNAFKRVCRYKSGEVQEDGVMDFLYCINSNPYIAVVSLINDTIMYQVRDLTSLINRFVSRLYTTDVSGGNINIRFSHPMTKFLNVHVDKVTNITNADIFSYMFGLSTSNNDSAVKTFNNDMLRKMANFTDSLVKDYCLAIINQVFLQGNKKLTNLQLRKTYILLCDIFDRLPLFYICVYLRYKYFNPVVPKINTLCTELKDNYTYSESIKNIGCAYVCHTNTHVLYYKGYITKIVAETTNVFKKIKPCNKVSDDKLLNNAVHYFITKVKVSI